VEAWGRPGYGVYSVSRRKKDNNYNCVLSILVQKRRETLGQELTESETKVIRDLVTELEVARVWHDALDAGQEVPEICDLGIQTRDALVAQLEVAEAIYDAFAAESKQEEEIRDDLLKLLICLHDSYMASMSEEEYGEWYEERFGHPPPPVEARNPDHPDFGKYNTVVTREMYEEAGQKIRAYFRKRLFRRWLWILLAALSVATAIAGLAWLMRWT